jgi:phosphoserine phosphatase
MIGTHAGSTGTLNDSAVKVITTLRKDRFLRETVLGRFSRMVFLVRFFSERQCFSTLFNRDASQYARSMEYGQWSPSVDEALHVLFTESAGVGAPVAVFDADGTLWSGDASEDFLAYVDKHDLFRPAEEIGPIFSHHSTLYEHDQHQAHVFAVQVCEGQRESQVVDWANACFEDHAAKRVFPEMSALIRALHALHWRVYIVTASPVWVVRPGARLLGVPDECVLAVDVEKSEGILTNRIREPMSMGEGKVACIRQSIGREPLLAVGNSWDDVPMMTHATGLAIVVNPSETDGDRSSLRQLALDRGWAVHYMANES